MSPDGTLTRYRALTAALWLDKGYDSRPLRLDKLRAGIEKSGQERGSEIVLSPKDMRLNLKS